MVVLHMPVQRSEHVHVHKEAEHVCQICIGLSLSGSKGMACSVLRLPSSLSAGECPHECHWYRNLPCFEQQDHSEWILSILKITPSCTVLHVTHRSSLVDSSSGGVDDQRAAGAAKVWQIQAHD